jgi:iron complex transport system ATP-binding protein
MNDLAFDALSVRVRGRLLLDQISLTLAKGDFVALVGPNGAGKTTLVKAALGLHKPESGAVWLGGTSLSALTPRQRAARVAWLPQHALGAEPLSATDGVAAARFRFDESHAASRRAARSALERVGAQGYAERSLTELSGGERQRVRFAALIAQDAPVLLLDEPANHLDPAQQAEVYRLLGELWREGRTVLCISHDLNLLAHAGASARVRVAGLRAGRLAFETQLTDSHLPSTLGSLFGIEMVSFENGQGHTIVPRVRSAP